MSNSRVPRTLPFAVIVGLDSITGVQTARIFAERGIPVIGISRDLDHPCSRTRVCEQVFECDIGSDAVVELLAKLGPLLQSEQPQHKSVLVPCSDRAVTIISRDRARLTPWYHVGMPANDTMEMLMDKISFYRFATQHGFAVPKTFVITRRSEAEDAARALQFPCILKPHRKTREWEKNSGHKAFKIANEGEFLRTYDRCAAYADALLAQEWIEGPDSNLYSCNCYFNANGEPLVTFVARKLRQWPPEAGTSCLGEECRNDHVLNESLRLFREVRFQGLGYVEMKQSSRDGRYVIVEPNVGRPTGRSAIAEAGGVELLFTMYCDLLGLPLPENLQQQYRGVKWSYLRNDLLSAYQYWKLNKLSTLAWIRSLRGIRKDALFSWKDPAPFVIDFAHSFRDLLRRSGAQPASRTRRAGEGALQTNSQD